MNRNQLNTLREHQCKYQAVLDEKMQSRNILYKKREKFVSNFSADNLSNLELEEYVIGNQNKNGFCYRLTHDLEELGKINIRPIAYGIYVDKSGSNAERRYHYKKDLGTSPEEAFRQTKNNIIDLLEKGEKEDLGGILINPLAKTFKGKILSTYFPETYLNIFSEKHLKHYLIHLNLDTHKILKKDVVFMRKELLSFKNSDEIFKEWSIDMFSNFLYEEHPGPPRKEKINQKLKKHESPVFQEIKNIEVINLEILPCAENSKEKNSTATSSKTPYKPDYDSESKKQRAMGDRGEKIVLEYEQKKLIEVNRKDLSKKVCQISIEDDSHGYDILSYSSDGTEIHIEVKATSSKPGALTCYLTENELRTAKCDDKYHLYIVFNVQSSDPLIWDAGNPFSPRNENISIKPIKYIVKIKT